MEQDGGERRSPERLFSPAPRDAETGRVPHDDLHAALDALVAAIEVYSTGQDDPAATRRLAQLARRTADLAAHGTEASGGFPPDRRDQLTGLANRRAAIDRLEQWAGDGSGTTVVFVDLDRFKTVNDSYGHSTGDEILRQVARRLEDVTRVDDVVARVAGDEFLVLAQAVEAEDEVDVALRIAEAMSFTAVVGQLRVPITASAGCAVHHPGETADDVVANADVAMHLAKQRGGSQLVRFDGEMRTRLLDKLSLEREIRYGLEHDEFVVYFQPVIDLATGRLVGAEALVRWNHPGRGRLDPAEFIEAAEDAGLIGLLDTTVLRLVVAQIARWQAAELIEVDFRVGVNVSGDRFGEQELVGTVVAELDAARVDAGRLVLEITETAMMRDVELSLATMRELTRVGLRLSVDDFGTGWSSLAYLKQFPVESLKIDQSFVAGLRSNADDEAIVRATVQLAGALGLRVVAEGVERPEQAEVLRDLGCGTVQGYFYSRPLDPESFAEQWLGRDPQR